MKRILLALILIGAAAQAQNLNDVEQLMEKKHFKITKLQKVKIVLLDLSNLIIWI